MKIYLQKSLAGQWSQLTRRPPSRLCEEGGLQHQKKYYFCQRKKCSTQRSRGSKFKMQINDYQYNNNHSQFSFSALKNTNNQSEKHLNRVLFFVGVHTIATIVITELSVLFRFYKTQRNNSDIFLNFAIFATYFEIKEKIQNNEKVIIIQHFDD